MAWTYADPNTDPKDAVRFLVGDTDPNDKLVQDEEINFIIKEVTKGKEPTLRTLYRSGAQVARAIAAKFARDVDLSSEGDSITASQRMAHYLALANELAKKYGDRAAPWHGNVGEPLRLFTGMHDHSQSGPRTTTSAFHGK